MYWPEAERPLTLSGPFSSGVAISGDLDHIWPRKCYYSFTRVRVPTIVMYSKVLSFINKAFLVLQKGTLEGRKLTSPYKMDLTTWT